MLRVPRARKLGERSGKEIERTSFNIIKEAEASLLKEGGLVSYTRTKRAAYRKAVFPKTFGTTKKTRGANYIGSIEIPGKGTTYWYVNRREKQGTIKDRKK